MRKLTIKDIEMQPTRSVSLRETDLREWLPEQLVLDYGMIMICRSGSVTIGVNFSQWQLMPGSVLTFFPNDVISIKERSDDFKAEALRYDASLLREASLQLEQTVYSRLKADRCRNDTPMLTNIINGMFGLLKLYFDQPECICLDQLVLLQLKAFFLGFHDYLYRNPDQQKTESGTPRMRDLFNRFMMEMEARYRECRDVKYYAQRMNITPKYLNTIASTVTGHSAKTLIDHFVVLQLKLTLKTSGKSIKEIAWDYHFSDDSFFCRYFKQRAGMTPQQFRKKEALQAGKRKI